MFEKLITDLVISTRQAIYFKTTEKYILKRLGVVKLHQYLESYSLEKNGYNYQSPSKTPSSMIYQLGIIK